MLFVLALVLVAPSEVFEEWSLVRTAPLAEVVTARALYHRTDGDTAVLPLAVQGTTAPEVHAFGLTRSLAVTAGPRGWQCALPPGERETVRLVARLVRAPEAPRMFHLRWPRVRAETSPTRRVAMVPRDWLEDSPSGWTCPEEPDVEVPCVSHERRPSPIALRVPAPPSPRGTVPLAFTLTTVALSVVGWSTTRRVERLAAGLGGASVAVSVCLSLAGAYVSSWGVSACVLLPLGALVGAAAPQTRWGSVLGAAALVTVPLLAVFGAPASVVFGVAALMSAAVAMAALTPPR